MMTKVDIWMPLYVADYLADTSRLTTEQHGAYLLLLIDYWRNGSLPDDDVVLAQITRMTPDAWSNARSTLQAYFKHEDGRWVHNRVEAELLKAKQSREKAKSRASAAAKARWDASSNAQSNATSNAKAMREDMLVQCPSPSPSQNIKPPKPPKGGSSPISFEEYLRRCKEENKLPIAEDHPVFAYAAEIKLPQKFLKLQWLEFKHRHLEPGSKKYKDWPKAFGNSVRGNWYKLWFADSTGYSLTTTGIQAKNLHKEAA